MEMDSEEAKIRVRCFLYRCDGTARRRYGGCSKALWIALYEKTKLESEKDEPLGEDCAIYMRRVHLGRGCTSTNPMVACVASRVPIGSSIVPGVASRYPRRLSVTLPLVRPSIGVFWR